MLKRRAVREQSPNDTIMGDRRGVTAGGPSRGELKGAAMLFPATTVIAYVPSAQVTVMRWISRSLSLKMRPPS